jgi:hypothetical protein
MAQEKKQAGVRHDASYARSEASATRYLPHH